MKKFILITLFLFELQNLSAQIIQKWNHSEPASTGYGALGGWLDKDNNYYCLVRRWYWSIYDDTAYVRRYDTTGALLWQTLISPDTSVHDTANTDIQLRGNSDGYTLVMDEFNNGNLLACVAPDGHIVYKKYIPGHLAVSFHIAKDRFAYYTNLDNSVPGLHLYILDSLGTIIRHDTLISIGMGGDIMSEDNFGNTFVYLNDLNNNVVVYRYQNHQKVDSTITSSGSVLHKAIVKTDSIFRYISVHDIRKYDSNWNLLSIVNLDNVQDMIFDSQHNIYALQDNNYDYKINKIDPSGTILWTYNINFPSAIAFSTYNLFVNPNDEIIFCGQKFDIPLNGNNDNNKIFITHIDTAGHIANYFERYFPGVTSARPENQFFGNNCLYCTINTYSEDIITCIDTRPNPTIEGKLYYDGNTNCQFDTTESIFPNIILTISPGNFNTTSDFIGNYYFNVPNGNYSVNCIAPQNYQNSCFSSQSVTVTNGAGNVQPEFGIVALNNVNDLSMDVTRGAIRSNRPLNFIIHYQNLGPLPLNGYINCTLDNTFSFVQSFPAPDSVSGNVLSWNFSNLLSGESKYIILQVMPSIQAAGTPFLNSFSANAINVNDTYIYNNNYSDSGVYVASCDPNEKYVSPCAGPSGAILPADSLLRYRIVFQNTGNDTAFYVQVIDTLDSSLDPTTFQVGAIYPDGNWSMQNNVLKFTFNPIYLPDSTTDELNSHGYINYSIKQKPNLTVGTEIHNRAYIYFDHNPAVLTNVTLNTITNLSSLENIIKNDFAEIFPNPSPGIFKVRLKSFSASDKVVVIVRNMLGKVVYQSEIDSGNFEINLNNENTGIYLCTFICKESFFAAKLVMNGN